MISVPGEHAAAEAQRALERDLHVMLFSDNVSVADEVSLKELAQERGLLLMGPDCGTAIVNGVGPLVLPTRFGVETSGMVGASGTGIQENQRPAAPAWGVASRTPWEPAAGT